MIPARSSKYRREGDRPSVDTRCGGCVPRRRTDRWRLENCMSSRTAYGTGRVLSLFWEYRSGRGFKFTHTNRLCRIPAGILHDVMIGIVAPVL